MKEQGLTKAEVEGAAALGLVKNFAGLGQSATVAHRHLLPWLRHLHQPHPFSIPVAVASLQKCCFGSPSRASTCDRQSEGCHGILKWPRPGDSRKIICQSEWKSGAGLARKKQDTHLAIRRTHVRVLDDEAVVKLLDVWPTVLDGHALHCWDITCKGARIISL